MPKSEKFRIASHADLLRAGRLLDARLRKNPRLGMLLMVDPVVAMKEAGLVVSDSIVAHVRGRLRQMKLEPGDPRIFDRIRRGTLRLPWVQGVWLNLRMGPGRKRTRVRPPSGARS